MTVSMLSNVAFAADSGSPGIQFGANNINGYDATTGYDYIYYGAWSNSPLKWRVLDDQTNVGSEGFFLLLDEVPEKNIDYTITSFTDHYPLEDQSALWQGSNAQAWCKDFAGIEGNGVPDAFSTTELDAILETTKTDESYYSDAAKIRFFPYENILDKDKVFFLSVEEVEKKEYGFINDDARILPYGKPYHDWWLRSYFDDIRSHSPGQIQWEGKVYIGTAFLTSRARPAFNLKLSSILFASPATGGKASSGMEFSEIKSYSGNEWKVTLLDSKRNFSISNVTIDENTVTFSYSDAQVGENEYISAVIEENGALTHYGRILHLNGADGTTSGTASISLPAGTTLDDDTKLYVFNEQYNGGVNDDTKLTDYASQLVEVNLTADSAAPTITAGDVERISETDATVKFTSDTAGSYYYKVVESGASEPDLDTSGTGTSCDTSEQTISLTDLTSGEKDIYIIVKDQAGNESNKLKVTIPDYIAPSYGILVSPEQLDFGSETVGYTTAPAAQTVTISNTGDQEVKLTQSVSEHFTIGTLSESTLAPEGTATFTVQPTLGLGTGNYDETLTVSGEGGVSADVSLTFAVTDAADPAPEDFTLNVELNGGSGSAAGGSYAAGAKINIDAGTRENYRFSGWTSTNGGSFENASHANTTFTMPAANTTVTANWQYVSSGSGGGGSGSTTKYYRLTFDTNGGDAITSIRRARNTVVDLAGYTPVREGYTFNGWYADKELTEPITEIKMTSDKTVYAGWERAGVPDSLNGDDHFAYVVGYTDGSVRPLNNISRMEAATIFFRLLDPEVREANLTTVNTFDDVNEGTWFNTPVSTMAKLGIIKGRSASEFDPDAPITRSEFAAICARFDTTLQDGNSNFTDIAGHWAEAEIERAATLGWIMGYADGSFRPENDITRAEAMTMINRMLQRLPEAEDDLLPDMNVWPDNQPGAWYYLAVQEATNSHDFDRKEDGLHEHWTQMTEDPDWKQYE